MHRLHAHSNQYLITGGHLGTLLQQSLNELKVTITYGLQQRSITILHGTGETGEQTINQNNYRPCAAC